MTPASWHIPNWIIGILFAGCVANPDGSPKMLPELRTTGLVIALGNIASAVDQIETALLAAREENGRMRDALRQKMLCIDFTGPKPFLYCKCYGARWDERGPEVHAPGCLAALPAEAGEKKGGV